MQAESYSTTTRLTVSLQKGIGGSPARSVSTSNSSCSRIMRRHAFFLWLVVGRCDGWMGLMESLLSGCYISLRCGMRVGNKGESASGGWPSLRDSFGVSSSQLECDLFNESTYLGDGPFERRNVALPHRLETIGHKV